MGCKPGDVFVHVRAPTFHKNSTDLPEEHCQPSELSNRYEQQTDVQYQLEDDSVNSLLDYGVMTVGCTHGMFLFVPLRLIPNSVTTMAITLTG